MSLGSRIAKRARAAVNANLASTPREPLLFLYPQWSRNSSTSAKLVHEPQHDKPLPTRKNVGKSTLPDPLKQKNPSSLTRRVEESLEKLTIEEGNEAEDDDAFQVRHVLATNATRETAAPERAKQYPDSTVRRVLATEKPPKEHFNGLDEQYKPASESDCARKPRFFSRPGPGEPISQSHDIHEPVFVPRNIMPQKDRLKRRVGRILEKNSRMEASARINSETDSAYKNHLRQMREELKDPWIVDWRDILSDLKKYTPSHGPWLERALRIAVPEAATTDLVHAIDGHLWDIGMNYGCSVNMDTGDEGKKGRSFLISGSLVALGKFTADIIRVAPEVKIFSAGANGDSADLEEQDDDLASTAVRFKPTEMANVDWRLAPDKIPKPDTWTPDTFLEYVRAITGSSISNHIKMIDREGKHDPDLRVLYVSMISDLFSDPECIPHITKTACHEALRFFLDMNMIKDLRILFVRMSVLDIGMDVETFNIMLRGTAKSRNLAAFHFILHLMVNRGFIPNPRTWLAFLEAHSDMEIRIHVINGMKERGLLRNKAVLKGICFGITKYEIEASLDSQQSQEEFIAHMDARYTPFWLSKGSGSRILDALGSRGLISRCWEFLHFMQARNIDPNTACINTILFHCKEQRNFTGAIEVLRALPPTRKYVPNQETFDRLFFMAWESQNYNMVRVVWRYACLYAATSARMRNHMFRSLQIATKSKEPEVGRARFRQLVGPVVFGNSWQGTHPVQFLNKMAARCGSLSEDISKSATGKRTSFLNEPENRTTPDSETDSESIVEDSSHDQSIKPLLRRVESKTRDATGQPIEPLEPGWVFVPTDLDGSSPVPEDPEPNEPQIFDSSPTDVHPQSDSPEVHISLSFPDHSATFDYSYLSQSESQAQNSNSAHVRISKNRDYRRKIRFLHELARLDHLMYRKWEPVKPMSVMLVEAAERDKEWRHKKWLAKQKGEVPLAEGELILERDRMIQDCVEVEVRTRDGMFWRAWK